MKKLFLALMFFILFYQDVKAQGFLFTHTIHPISATVFPMQNLSCLKEGKATLINILYLFEWGDAGIDTAACQGCITQIHYVNQSETSFLFLFKKLTTLVYGN